MGDRIEPVGLPEIAERLGVPRATVDQWRYRSTIGKLPEPMPEPRWTVGGGPAWNWADVERWAKRTNRLAAVTS